MKCRHCKANLTVPFVDLGSAPPSNNYLTAKTLNEIEKWFPLRVLVCTNCWLVQTEDFSGASELFNADYAYFSSFSSSWLAHAERYVSDMITKFNLHETSYVVEVAANDGYLLQYMLKNGIQSLGIEPTNSTAVAARKKGITILEDFFGVRLALELTAQRKQPDLIIANNVLAHVPDINDFVKGFSILLKPGGIATFEFPHLMRLVAENQFDTIYHEHFSYLSFTAVNRILDYNGLMVFDVEELSTHGGSLRVFAQRKDFGLRKETAQVAELLARESEAGMTSIGYYTGFQPRIEKIKNDLLIFLIEVKRSGKKLAGYGAAAKGNTLLNFAGIRSDLIPFVSDRNPAKQGKYLPGSRIPILAEAAISENRPDYVIILPWNLREELTTQLLYIKDWGGRFVTAVPKLEII